MNPIRRPRAWGGKPGPLSGPARSPRRSLGCSLGLIYLLGLLGLVPRAAAQSAGPAEAYFFGPFSLSGGARSFRDLHPGDDLLPYTSDDLALPPRGNAGGSWCAAHHDLDSDRRIDTGEPIFSAIHRDDDALQTFSVLSRPEYGVLYESEDWYDYHEARNQGPSASRTGDPQAEGEDFEHNDRPPWEHESNGYLYNNLLANQHGKGRPRYYFEHVNRSVASLVAPGEPWVYEEAEGFEKPLSFQNNLDDPATARDETGACRRDYMRTLKAVTRGYLIPAGDLPGLEDGSLPSLFGWEDVDLAAYLRETIAPLLEDPALELWLPGAPGPYHAALPATHLMLLQVEAPVEISGETCPQGLDEALAMAAPWGLPERGATYRVSSLLGFNAHLEEWLGPGIHEWRQVPPGGEPRNLWLQDFFFRHDRTHLGRYETAGGPWAIVPHEPLRVLEATADNFLRAAPPASLRLPLPRPVGPGELPWELVVDVARGEGGVTFQVILEGPGGEAVVYGEAEPGATSVHLGGSLSADGRAAGSRARATGPGAPAGSLAAGEFSRYVLRVTERGVTLGAGAPGSFAPAELEGPGRHPVLAELAAGRGEAAVAAVRLTAIAGGEVAIDTLAFLAAPPGAGGRTGPFLRGDCDQNGSASGTVTDAVVLLRFNFASRPAPPCLAACDANGDGRVRGQVTDAVYLLNFSFRSGPPPAAPYPECAPSARPGDLELGCERPGCR